MIRRRKYTPLQVRSATVQLPKSLAFLKAATFLRLIEEPSATASKWSVELAPTTFRKLLAAQAKSKHHAADRAPLENQIKELQAEIRKLEGELKDERHRAQVLVKQQKEFAGQVVTEQGTFRAPRSPKNYLAVAGERGTNFGSPSIQGGSAGLEKK